jgi:hypothetical protein
MELDVLIATGDGELPHDVEMEPRFSPVHEYVPNW